MGIEIGHLAGDSWQQGGVFLMGPLPTQCSFAHREEHPGHHIDQHHLLQQVLDLDEGVAMNYSVALARLTQHRRNNRHHSNEEKKYKEQPTCSSDACSFPPSDRESKKQKKPSNRVNNAVLIVAVLLVAIAVGYCLSLLR
ncbi:hypothetical protein QOT17_003444 [Balamuthia mandrillaris]